MNSNSTLSTGKYEIELKAGITQIYTKDEEGRKIWVCATTDPEKAMDIVEGLILVETKRFYKPEASPKISSEGNEKIPPFIRNLKSKY